MKKYFCLAALFIAALLLCALFAFFREEKKSELTKIDTLLKQYDLSEQADAKDVLTVGKRKQFPSLSEAVAEAKDGDVIVVFSGKYVESVHAANKTIYIIGESRGECMLSYSNANYFSPPVEMGSGMLANMTVYAVHQEIEEGAIAKAYSLHVDFDISKNAQFQVIDVDFINESYQTIGIGLRENFTLRFQNCLFECKGDNNAFYCHDDPTREGSANQRLIVENCRFVNNGTNASTILIQSQEAPNSEILCEWNNNTVENRAGGKLLATHLWKEKASSESGWLGLSFWKNAENSNGNSLAELNRTH